VHLAELIGALDDVEVVGDADPDVVVTAIDYDSRAVGAGSVFCCLPGTVVDGHDFAAEAIERGAAAVVVERALDLPAATPQLVVPGSRRAMGLLAATLAGHPSGQLQVVGITGTNGKTTTAHLLQSILEHAGRRCGLIGTLTGQRTTPESPDLQTRLRQFVDDGADAVAMEVSSHALALGRVDGTRFAVAVFTNLSRDHLDFHESMEDYFHAKALLFDPDRADRAVVNIDDPNGRLLFEAATLPTRGFGMADADDIELGVASSSFRWRDQRVVLPMGGVFNVLNAIGAAEVAIDLGLDAATIADALAAVAPVPGRFELVDRGQPFSVVVDYAHTPDGLEQVLRSARRVVGDGRVVVVFGCGGERDVSKRPAMGEVASRLADQLYLTSDNPRGEDPEEIIDDVRRGIPTDRGLVVDPDRRSAIFAAVAAAGADDIVVIAGKGHETTQTIGTEVLPFDDRLVASEALDASGAAGGDA
jgi:UDP-N-acetylmuramoyl-L-alanyl-D-glutamate--2,6-diaminopimelate ligase